jgi:hypothetical protein
MSGIQDWLGELPNGEVLPLNWDEVGAYLREHYIKNGAEADRRSRHDRRSLLYADAGDAYLAKMINDVFQDQQVVDKRLQWVRAAKYNNVLKRVINELSTIYKLSAKRTISGDDTNYREVRRLCRQDEVFQRIERWLNLHRNLFVGFRVRETSGARVPVIDVVTPGQFHAVAHPYDRTKLLGPIFDQSITGPRATKDDPAQRMWTDSETFAMTGDGKVIAESHRRHGFPRMPWILLSLEPPANGLLDSTGGEDLVAAHMAVWFENVCLLKESKSATKQPVLVGDMTNTARAQAADSEVPLEAAEGLNASVLDYSMDLSLFRDTAQDILEKSAANYGIPPSLLRHDSVASAQARELMRVPLRELRQRNEIPLREFEREFVRLQAMVLERDMPELAFSPDGFSVNFAESQSPLSAKEEDEVFVNRRRLGLTDTIEEIIRRDPDLTEDQAWDSLGEHITREVQRNLLMRPLQAISGSLGAPSPNNPPRGPQPSGEKDEDQG